MKLYGTIKSDRAQKSQGGNEFLDIEISGENRNLIATISIKQVDNGYDMSMWRDEDNVKLNSADRKCKCIDSTCAKCLLINCVDTKCRTHPEDKKREFRELYKNR